MSDPLFDAWLDEQIARLRIAVTPMLKSVYYERESLRTAVKEKDAALVQQANQISALNAEILQLRTTVALKDTEIAALKRRIAELLNPPPPPPPPPVPPPYVANRMQVVWAAGTAQANVENILKNRSLTNVSDVIVTADIKSFQWGRDLIQRCHDMNTRVWAYVRAPIHARIGAQGDYTVPINPTVPFEYEIYQLVKNKDAWVRNSATGQPSLVAGNYDVYIVPWLIAKEHAALVRQLAWDATLFSGLLIDALPTNRIYAGGGGDFDNDRVADVITDGWKTVSMRQRAALELWLAELGGIPVIANDSFEPVSLTPYVPSSWIGKVAGCFDENLTHPMYRDGNDFQQEPATSQRPAMHLTSAADWLAAGKMYLMGGDFRLFNLPRTQSLPLLIATALLAGARAVCNEEHPWLRTQLGKPIGVPESDSNRIIWTRQYERGSIRVNWTTKIGEVIST